MNNIWFMVLDRAGMVASKIRCRWNRTMPGNYIKVPLVIIGIDRAWTRNLVQENLEIPCRDPVIFDYERIINVLHVDL